MRLTGMKEYRLGVVSDTHGLLRPEVVRALQGVDLIVHAGDVGNPQVLSALETVAPVAAVRGNVDVDPWARRLPETAVVEAGEALLYVLHDLDRLDLDPAAGGFQGVISGHSHRPALVRHEEVLYLNPGSIGPRRFHLPVCLAVLKVNGKTLEAKHLTLTC